MAEITVTINISDEELADAVWHNLWRSSSPWIASYGYADFETDPVVTIRFDDPDTDELTTKEVSVADLARGLSVCLDKGYHHCGERFSADVEDWDACVSDGVLQAALFGKIVYG